MGYRDHRVAGLFSQHPPARRIGTFLPRGNPGSLGEDDDPTSRLEARGPLLNHTPQGQAVCLAVDGDGLEHGQTPAKQRQPQELAFGHPDLRREDELQGPRLPGRLMFSHNDGWTFGDMLEALGTPVQLAGFFQPPEGKMGPTGYDPIA